MRKMTKKNQIIILIFRFSSYIDSCAHICFLTRRRQLLVSVTIFDFKASFWETQKWLRKTLFVKYSGNRFLTDISIHNTHNMKDRLIINQSKAKIFEFFAALRIEKNQRHDSLFFRWNRNFLADVLKFIF